MEGSPADPFDTQLRSALGHGASCTGHREPKETTSLACKEPHLVSKGLHKEISMGHIMIIVA